MKNKIMKNYNYDITARLFPAFLCSLPIFVFYYFFLDKTIPNFLKFIFDIRYDYISMIIVFTYLMAQICRFIGKFIFQNKFFKGEVDFPTTIFLLKNDNQYSKQFKDKMRDKIIADFNINIYQDDDEAETKRRISEAVSFIRNKVKNGRLLLKHNIEYGFWRNFIGGAVVSSILSIFNCYFFYFYNFEKIAFIVSVVLLIIYLLPIILSKIFINNLGKNYAKILFQEYLG